MFSSCSVVIALCPAGHDKQYVSDIRTNRTCKAVNLVSEEATISDKLSLYNNLGAFGTNICDLYYCSMMRRSSMLLKNHMSWIFQKSCKFILAKLIFKDHSYTVMVIEKIRSSYFVLWYCEPIHNETGVLQRLVYLLQTFWTLNPTFLFGHTLGKIKFALIVNKNRLERFWVTVTAFWQYCAKEIL